MSDANLYRKVGKRYEPIGRLINVDYLTDGIWYVHHTKHSKGITSCKHLEGVYRVGEAQHIDLAKLCGMADLSEKILDSQEFRDVVNSSTGYSLHDIVDVCVNILTNECEKVSQ